MHGIDGGADHHRPRARRRIAQDDRPAQTLALHHLLERQHYRLSHWRLASSDINYRRFFDINSLAGLRVEDAGTFDAMHALVRRLIAEDKSRACGIDHIDGLQRSRAISAAPAPPDPRGAGQQRRARSTLLIEKILGEGEKLRAFAACDGTTGYEWLNAISQVLLLPARAIDRSKEIWRQISKPRRSSSRC